MKPVGRKILFTILLGLVFVFIALPVRQGMASSEGQTIPTMGPTKTKTPTLADSPTTTATNAPAPTMNRPPANDTPAAATNTLLPPKKSLTATPSPPPTQVFTPTLTLLPEDTFTPTPVIDQPKVATSIPWEMTLTPTNAPAPMLTSVITAQANSPAQNTLDAGSMLLGVGVVLVVLIVYFIVRNRSIK